MRIAKNLLTLLAFSIAAAVPAAGQIQEGNSSKLDAEVAKFSPYVQSSIKDYSGRLIANVDQFSKMDVSNCHLVSDITVMFLHQNLDSVEKDTYLQWLVFSRALAYLSLEKFDDHSKPLAGSYAEKIENGNFSGEEIIALLPAERTRCSELFVGIAGQIVFPVEQSQGHSK